MARLRALDPVTIRGGAAARRGPAQLPAVQVAARGQRAGCGWFGNLYEDIEHYENSGLLSDAHKAALRYVDALIWSPARISPAVAAGVREVLPPPSRPAS